MMFVPPLPPTTPASWPSLSMTSGVMEERGRLPGAMKFAGAGGSWPGARFAGTEKSSISLFSTMPVDGDSTLAPK